MLEWGGYPAIQANMTVPLNNLPPAGTVAENRNNNNNSTPNSNSLTCLTGCISVDTHVPLRNTTSFRCYGGNIVMSTPINGKKSINQTNVIYRIGRRSMAINDCLVDCTQPGGASGRFRILESMNASLTGIARKYSNFAPDYTFCDYSAIIANLASAIAFFSVQQRITPEMLRRGHPLSIQSLATQFQPVQASSTTVFIPQFTSDAVAPATFCALVNATLGTGAVVVTDILQVDLNTNAPLIIGYVNLELVRGCLHAIRLLIAIMEKSGAGTLGMLAFIIGVHRTLTVVGHSDEGAIMRDIFRNVRFSRPYGAIFPTSTDDFHAVPTVARHSAAGYQALVDAIALTSAALCALADPCAVLDGRAYPTIVTSSTAPTPDGVIDADTRSSIYADLLDKCRPFITTYMSLISRAYVTTNAANEQAANLLYNGFSTLNTDNNRHICGLVLAPFYWIEPTTLFRSGFSESVAQQHGFGILAGTEVDGTLPYLEPVQQPVEDSGSMSMYVRWRSSRTVGAVLFHETHRNDGLGCFFPQQLDPELLLLPGRRMANANAFNGRNPLNDFLWVRGDAGVPHPAECLYLGKSIGTIATIRRFTLEAGFTTPLVKDLSNLLSSPTVNISAQRPILLHEINTIGEQTAEVARTRNRSALILSQVQDWTLRNNAVNLNMMRFSRTDPEIEEQLPIVVVHDVEPLIEQTLLERVAESVPTALEPEQTTVLRGPSQAHVGAAATEHAHPRSTNIAQTDAQRRLTMTPAELARDLGEVDDDPGPAPPTTE